MRTLKKVSSTVLLITGIITAITGAIESIVKTFGLIRVKEMKAFPTDEVSHSTLGFHLGGFELIFLGVIIIFIAILVKRLY